MRLIGLDDVVELKPFGSDMLASGIDRDDVMFYTLPKLIVTSQRRPPRWWLPLGLEVNLP